MERREAESREASYFIPSLSKKIRNDRQMDERKESEGEREANLTPGLESTRFKD